jgi:hypothetical protein
MIEEPQLYECIYCKQGSLRLTMRSYSWQYSHVRRTDGSFFNHSRGRDIVTWCVNCEKFNVLSKMKWIRSFTDVERNEQFAAKGSRNTLDWSKMSKKFMLGSKKYNEYYKEWTDSMLPESQDGLTDSELKKGPKWFRCLQGPEEIKLALMSSELARDSITLYKLRVQFWQAINEEGACGLTLNVLQPEADEIFSKLIHHWKGRADERYLFKAEMLRNLGEFKRSSRLLLNSAKKYLPVLEKYPGWVQVLKTMNDLKLMQTVEIRVGSDFRNWGN